MSEVEELGLGRLLVALPTPLDERAGIDMAALDHLVGYFGERSLPGVALFTEAGEGLFFEPAEQARIVERVLKRAPKSLQVWLQLNHFWTRAAVEAARHAEALGAAGLLVALPRLPDVGYPELYRHIDRTAKATKLPMLLVVRPGDLVSSLAPEEQTTLSTHPRLSGAFLSEGGTSQVKTWAKRFDGRGEVHCACSFEFLDTAQCGAMGVICALAALAPEPAKAMMRSRTDAVRLRRIQKQMRGVVDRLGPPRTGEAQRGMERLAERIARRPLDSGRVRGLAPAALIKEGLRLQGHPIKPFVRPPQPQITDEERERLRVLLRSCGMLG